MSTLYVPRPPVDDLWQPTHGVPLVAMPKEGGFPLRRHPWNYYLDDPGFWVKPSEPLPTLALPAGGGFPFPQRYWRYNYDDTSFWVGTPNQRIPALDEPVGGGIPFKSHFWKYYNDDPGFWVGDKTIAQFQSNLLFDHITSTFDLELPIDYFLADNPLNIISDEKTVLGKLFTTRTSKKGYD